MPMCSALSRMETVTVPPTRLVLSWAHTAGVKGILRPWVLIARAMDLSQRG
jgi:hypothetical protein